MSHSVNEPTQPPYPPRNQPPYPPQNQPPYPQQNRPPYPPNHRDAKAQAKAARAYAKSTRPWYAKKRTWLLGLLALLFIVGIFQMGNGGDAPAQTNAPANNAPATTPAAAPLVVTADKLLRDLEANALKANNTYIDKRVKVTGKVDNIDAQGAYFSIGPRNGRISFHSILMNIEPDLKDKVANLKDGQSVTAIGTVTDVGEVMGYAIDVESIG
ncbi:OB-fold putative lipoprotein [Nigerium massiliense]|uniref:OB-fold putative lipoprotein n=1 Tax=Nigerium massiliense TaxID=1522317 RepID=UPI001C44DCC7|nr:OB-fold putative lipoprotein [Nigerium massiliense]